MPTHVALTRRGESPWCKGDEGRLHVTEERPGYRGAVELVCRHCGALCAIRVSPEEPR